MPGKTSSLHSNLDPEVQIFPLRENFQRKLIEEADSLECPYSQTIVFQIIISITFSSFNVQPFI